ncbi:MAG TPA: cytochrome c [Gemmatimonadaceae bacterium]
MIATSILVPAPDANGQQGAARTQRSTRMGVYTREQWTRGRDVYAGMCAGCHPAVTHVGPVFTTLWAGKSVADLFGFMRERMPKNEPGSLSVDQYVDVLTYMLRLNGMPVGYDELPADSIAMTRIRIDSSLAAPPGTRPAR